jgi:Zn-dependent protease with chaperone function
MMNREPNALNTQTAPPAAPIAARTSPAAGVSAPSQSALSRIRSVKECISREERKQRFSVILLNGLVWFASLIFTAATWGLAAILYLVGKGTAWFLSEFNVRRLQSLGCAVSERQFPEVASAIKEVCEQFQVAQIPRVLVINVSATNAFAVKSARHKVIVLLSQTLEGVLDKPAELRFLLAHEMAHIVLDHGFRGVFEIMKPAAYKAPRELTCDNCGVAAAGSLDSAKTVLKRLGAGNELYGRLREEVLIEEADYIYSGLSGWLLKRHLKYPPLGKRILNVTKFATQA